MKCICSVRDSDLDPGAFHMARTADEGCNGGNERIACFSFESDENFPGTASADTATSQVSGFRMLMKMIKRYEFVAEADDASMATMESLPPDRSMGCDVVSAGHADLGRADVDREHLFSWMMWAMASTGSAQKRTQLLAWSSPSYREMIARADNFYWEDATDVTRGEIALF